MTQATDSVVAAVVVLRPGRRRPSADEIKQELESHRRLIEWERRNARNNLQPKI